jgi:peptidoglycan/xylan/chitin deacetylase (PgdA/CDA1 family)
MRIFKYGKIFEWLYPKRVWSIASQEKVIYLTFDDGPVPEATPFVLEELKKVNAKATFFMVGDNVKKHSSIYKSVVEAGHSVANHTMNHVNGTYCRTVDYVQNVELCQSQMLNDNPKKLFRPPYGKMTKKQEQQLSDYKAIMWSVLTYDFDPTLSAEKCLEKSINLTKNGSIVLMHDSVKTIEKLRYVLPKYLEHFTRLGYRFEVL